MAITPAAAASLLILLATTAQAADPLVYIGTYTRNKSKGIYAFRLSEADGKLTPLGLAAETTSPSFLALHPTGKFLYAVNEVGEFKGEKAGSVSAFSVDRATGKLTLLNVVSSKGGGPCHISIDPSGKTALVANYGGGSIASYAIGEDGRLSEAVTFIQHKGSSVNPARQREPHAHSINIDAKRKRAVVADLGLDKLFFYNLDAAAHTITEGVNIALPPGSGPRHYAAHPNGRYGYVINEMLLTIAAVDLTKTPPAIFQSVSTIPEKAQPSYSTAEVVVHPNGKFLYGSNRGHDTIASFSVDPKTGKLTPIGHTSTKGKTPRNFAIDPTGKYLIAANQDSDNIVVFRIEDDGDLTPLGISVEVGMPVCIRFLK